MWKLGDVFSGGKRGEWEGSCKKCGVGRQLEWKGYCEKYGKVLNGVL